ncbi:hypothetical protein ASPZODRAFT_134684 [Penicilliopsis zonata CBS 506.65]|uniref:Histone h1.3 n=1 Tax=Penicilliopsis zonata CBS 506.65 TaxID=1073090 RepID=A0A1L9SBM3_9EURO|nr:hypothetical protein ASPZODRAFT_134684 [Penicilliopsis zonata CBS 506.65]OJJ44600.1 hypothetical protein ASPZODRAFT_134684 [Penicilliopsis zonata CBS 506.65]
MATPSKLKPDSILGLSASEAKLIILGVLCNGEQAAKVDYEKLAQRGGYKNASSASVMYLKSKRKLFELHPDAAVAVNGEVSSTGGNIEGPKATPKKGSGKRKTPATSTPKEIAAGGEEATIDQPVTPTQKPKRQRKSTKKILPKEAARSTGTGKDSNGNGNTTGTGNDKMVDENAASAAFFNYDIDEDNELLGEIDIDAEFEAMEAAQTAVKAELQG